MLITKRSGQTEEYDRKKIALAITKAFKSTGIEQPDDLDELLDLVEKQILVTPGCSVETIQDCRRSSDAAQPLPGREELHSVPRKADGTPYLPPRAFCRDG